ncbi:ParB/RepB/Spo0J family partition protein [Blautia sp.]|uniref:ParB/RepB/Spo0J family partition protein n=1 Tax=Blautia sp. TaxID=1955243 RepID=UPI002586D245|nr:ParB/RepB/Spo0J family partition protein [Blautia sp.]
MKSSAKNIEMTSFDDLFGTPPSAGSGNIQEIALDSLFPFKNHPFKVLDDQTMEDMVESVREHGVLVPGIARPRAEGGYELIAGHRRRHASELAGKTVMPVIIRELDDDEAILFMVDSNIQRENLLPSEKAWAYKMKLDAIRRRAGRPGKGNSGQVGQNLKGKASVEIVAENAGESYKQVQRFIRLTELHPRLLQMVDDKKVPFNPAVELSYLTLAEQEVLLGVMEELSAVPSLEQAKRLKKYSQEGKLGVDVMDAILTEERPVPAQVTLKNDRLKKYFPKNYTPKQMEEVIFSLLETWKTEHE